jgi:hypothetical protein
MPRSTATLPEPVIRSYRPADYAGVLRGMQDLQDYERALHPSRRPAAEVAEVYLARLLRRVAERSGAIFVAEGAGAVIGFVACYIKDIESLIETAAFSRYGYVSDRHRRRVARPRPRPSPLRGGRAAPRAARRHAVAHRCAGRQYRGATGL